MAVRPEPSLSPDTSPPPPPPRRVGGARAGKGMGKSGDAGSKSFVGRLLDVARMNSALHKGETTKAKALGRRYSSTAGKDGKKKEEGAGRGEKRKVRVVPVSQLGGATSMHEKKYAIDLLRAVRKRRRTALSFESTAKRLAVHARFRQIILYVLFVIALSIATVVPQQEQDQFFLAEEIRSMLKETEFAEEDTHVRKTMADVSTWAEFYQWMRGPLHRFLYTGASLWIEDADAIANPTPGRPFGVLRLVGAARVGQVRLQPTAAECDPGISWVTKKGKVPKAICFGSDGAFSTETEATGSFGYNATDGSSGKWFTWSGKGSQHGPQADGGGADALYASIADERSETGIGLLRGSSLRTQDTTRLFPSPAYPVVLPYSGKGAAMSVIETLEELQYIDLQTKVVTIQFTVFSYQLETFCSVSILAETYKGGGIDMSVEARVGRVYTPFEASDFGTILCEMIVMLFYAYFVVVEVLKLRQLGTVHMFKSDTILHWANIACYAVLWVIRGVTLATAPVQDDVVIDERTYYPYNIAVSHRNSSHVIASIMCFLSFYRVISFLTIFPTFRVVSGTLSRAIVAIFSFLLVFGLFFYSFAAAHLLTFGTEDAGYRNMSFSAYTLLQGLLGNHRLEALRRSNWLMGPLYAVIFLGVSLFILLNVLIALILEAYEAEVVAQTENPTPSLIPDMYTFIRISVQPIPFIGRALDLYIRHMGALYASLASTKSISVKSFRANYSASLTIDEVVRRAGHGPPPPGQAIRLVLCGCCVPLRDDEVDDNDVWFGWCHLPTSCSCVQQQCCGSPCCSPSNSSQSVTTKTSPPPPPPRPSPPSSDKATLDKEKPSSVTFAVDNPMNTTKPPSSSPSHASPSPSPSPPRHYGIVQLDDKPISPPPSSTPSPIHHHPPHHRRPMATPEVEKRIERHAVEQAHAMASKAAASPPRPRRRMGGGKTAVTMEENEGGDGGGDDEGEEKDDVGEIHVPAPTTSWEERANRRMSFLPKPRGSEVEQSLISEVEMTGAGMSDDDILSPLGGRKRRRMAPPPEVLAARKKAREEQEAREEEEKKREEGESKLGDGKSRWKLLKTMHAAAGAAAEAGERYRQRTPKEQKERDKKLAGDSKQTFSAIQRLRQRIHLAGIAPETSTVAIKDPEEENPSKDDDGDGDGDGGDKEEGKDGRGGILPKSSAALLHPPSTPAPSSSSSSSSTTTSRTSSVANPLVEAAKKAARERMMQKAAKKARETLLRKKMEKEAKEKFQEEREQVGRIPLPRSHTDVPVIKDELQDDGETIVRTKTYHKLVRPPGPFLSGYWPHKGRRPRYVQVTEQERLSAREVEDDGQVQPSPPPPFDPSILSSSETSTTTSGFPNDDDEDENDVHTIKSSGDLDMEFQPPPLYEVHEEDEEQAGGEVEGEEEHDVVDRSDVDGTKPTKHVSFAVLAVDEDGVDATGEGEAKEEKGKVVVSEKDEETEEGREKEVGEQKKEDQAQVEEERGRRGGGGLSAVARAAGMFAARLYRGRAAREAKEGGEEGTKRVATANPIHTAASLGSMKEKEEEKEGGKGEEEEKKEEAEEGKEANVDKVEHDEELGAGVGLKVTDTKTVPPEEGKGEEERARTDLEAKEHDDETEEGEKEEEGKEAVDEEKDVETQLQRSATWRAESIQNMMKLTQEGRWEELAALAKQHEEKETSSAEEKDDKEPARRKATAAVAVAPRGRGRGGPLAAIPILPRARPTPHPLPQPRRQQPTGYVPSGSSRTARAGPHTAHIRRAPVIPSPMPSVATPRTVRPLSTVPYTPRDSQSAPVAPAIRTRAHPVHKARSHLATSQVARSRPVERAPRPAPISHAETPLFASVLPSRVPPSSAEVPVSVTPKRRAPPPPP